MSLAQLEKASLKVTSYRLGNTFVYRSSRVIVVELQTRFAIRVDATGIGRAIAFWVLNCGVKCRLCVNEGDVRPGFAVLKVAIRVGIYEFQFAITALRVATLA